MVEASETQVTEEWESLYYVTWVYLGDILSLVEAVCIFQKDFIW